MCLETLPEIIVPEHSWLCHPEMQFKTPLCKAEAVIEHDPEKQLFSENHQCWKLYTGLKQPVGIHIMSSSGKACMLIAKQCYITVDVTKAWLQKHGHVFSVL